MPKVSERRELLSNLQYLCACSFVDDDDEAFEEYSNMYAFVISSLYLTEREGLPKSHDFLLHYLFTQPPLMFKQHVRTTREGFCSLVRILEEHEIFNNNSRNPQIDVAYQVAVCLMRLGSYGNGAALQHAQRTFGISKGTVVLYTTRVIAALCSVRSQWVQWPFECRRKELSSVMEKEGFPGCVGFVDGTTLPLHQKPCIDGQSYFDRKHRYSISLQVVCDVDRRIISFLFGWPGSAHDAIVYKACDLFKRPANYFSSGQYILSDSAYPRSDTIIPYYRSPAALCPDNLEFNYCVAHSRVRNEHCISILKGRWSSLLELAAGALQTFELPG